MSLRIVKVAKQFNLPIKEIVGVLQKYGIDILPKPTAMISEEMMNLLYHHYNLDPARKTLITSGKKSFASSGIPDKPSLPRAISIPEKGDGYYQIPFKKLKFKDGFICIPFDIPSLEVLTFKPQNSAIYEMIKSKYSTSNEFLSVRVAGGKISNIDNVESLSKKLKISSPQQKMTEEIKSKNRKKRGKEAKLKPYKSERRKKVPKQPPEPQLPKPRIPQPVKDVVLKANITDIASYYSVWQKDIIEYLEIMVPWKKYALNSRLTLREAKIIQDHFTQTKLKTKTFPSRDKIEWVEFEDEPTQEPRIAFSILSSFEITKFDFELKEDKFSKSVGVICYPGLPDVLTYFSDLQAVDICSKMSSSLPRKRATDFGNLNNKNKELTRYEIHYMANKALNIFGGKILTLLCELRKLKFKTKNAFEVRTYRTVRPDFPFLHFKVGGEIINVAFFTREHKIKNKLTANSVIYSSTYNRIGFIDELGRVKLELQRFRPQLSLFINKVKDKNYQIHSGVETGVYEICKLPLTHPTSLLFGIGPVCARNLGIDLRNLNL